MKHLVLDYETRSEADLKKVGAFKYATHPSTELICAAWKLVDEFGNVLKKTKVWSPLIDTGVNPTSLYTHLINGTTMLVAHNALFEQVITRFVLPKYFPHPSLKSLPHDRWICTASLAAAWALPRKLDGACQALRLPVQKDMDGHKLMLKMSKPRKPTKHDKSKWREGEQDILRLMQYCKTDVDAEALLLKALPPLSPFERKVWLLDQKINFRGFKVDTDLVNAALSLTKKELQLLNEELFELTNGKVESANQRDVYLRYIKREGVDLKNMQAETLKDTLFRTDLTTRQRRLLEIRQEASKTSTAKYKAFKARMDNGGRVRDNLLYWGASTGRWAGMGVQPQNFPQGTLGSIEDVETAIEIIKERDLELVRLIYGNPLDAFSSCLRGAITATDNHEFFSEDFSAIEARVLLWLADDKAGLNIFHRGDDPYRHMAARIFGVELLQIPKKGLKRDLGKRAELGCGFGMGWKKFLETCHKAGLKHVTPKLAKKAVKIYREVHGPVVKMWKAQEQAAIRAVQTGKRVSANKVTWFMEGKILYCELPSGRRLAYYEPSIKYKETPWGQKRATLYHWQVHPKNKNKWVNDHTYGGKLVENIVQGVARDFMAAAMIRVDKANYKLVLTVHDELLAERKKKQGSQHEFSSLISGIPWWGQGCPIKTEGWSGYRYRK